MNFKTKVLIKCLALLFGMVIVQYVAYIPFKYGIALMSISKPIGILNCIFGLIILSVYIIFVVFSMKEDLEKYVKVGKNIKDKEK